MTGIYIATKAQADYDALMRLAEVAGYKWLDGDLPTEFNWSACYGKDTVVSLFDGKRMALNNQIYCGSTGKKIETIPNLADIVAIYTTKKLDWENYVKTKSISIPEGIYQSCVFELNDGNVWGSNRNYCKVLAVEYKPKESEEAMSEKVKLPKFMCDLLEGRKVRYPATALTITDQIADQSSEASRWLANIGNQWKLIDALRNGYEPEPEQLYYVQFTENDKFGYLNIRLEDGSYKADSIRNDSHFKTKFTMPEIIAIDPRYKAFAIPVEEVDKCTN